MNKFKTIALVIGGLFFVEGIGLIYAVNKSQNLSKKLKELAPDYEKAKGEEQELQSEKEVLARENQALKADRSNLIEQAKALMAERTRAEEFKEEMEKLEAEKKSLAKQMEMLKEERSAFEEETKRLRAKEIYLTKERDNFKGAYEKASKINVVNKLKQEIASLQGENRKAAAQIAKDAKDIKQLAGETVKLKKETNKLELEREEMRAELNSYKKNYAEAERKNKRLEADAKDIPKKFSELARQNTMLLKETGQMHYNLGVFYTKNKEYDRALVEFRKAVEINPDDAYAHFNAGYIYAEYLINRSKAIEHFRHFLRLTKKEDTDTDWVRKYILTWQSWEGKQPIE